MHHLFYTAAVTLVLALHLAWILFVMTGVCFTSKRPKLTALHLGSLLWGIVVETGPWPCPLTLLENFVEVRAGIASYSGSFLVHYLDQIVYPNLPIRLIVTCAVAVCAANLGVYCWRFVHFLRRRKDRTAESRA